MPRPIVSVVIPAFNAGAYIAESIASALNQTLEDLEVLVIDNRSTDDTLAIASQIGDPRVRVATCSKRGAAAARNAGIGLASGDYLQFLDADDVLASDKLQKQVAMLQEHSRQTVASCAWARFFDRPGDAEFRPQRVWKDYSPAWEWLLDSWQGAGMMQTACWLVPRRVAEAAGPWNESLTNNPNDDGEYFCRILLRSERVAFCPVDGVFYRSALLTSLSRRADDFAVESAFRTCTLYQEHVESAGLLDRFRHALRRNYLGFMYRYHPCRKDLMEKAWKRAESLAGARRAGVGGALFQRVARAIGFRNALRLRELASELRK